MANHPNRGSRRKPEIGLIAAPISGRAALHEQVAHVFKRLKYDEKAHGKPRGDMDAVVEFVAAVLYKNPLDVSPEYFATLVAERLTQFPHEKQWERDHPDGI